MLKCPTCTRVDADLGTCGSTTTCPMHNGAEPVEVTPDTHFVVHCDAPECHDLTRAIPVKALVHPNAPACRLDHVCPRGEALCRLRPMFARPAKPPAGVTLTETPKDAHQRAAPHDVGRRADTRKHAGPKGPAVP